MHTEKAKGDGGSAAQKHRVTSLADTSMLGRIVPHVSPDTTTEKGAVDKNKSTTNRNLAQGKGSDAIRTSTSYFDAVWNAFSKHTDGSMQWIPKEIVAT
jgi:hypothetical protein